MKIISENGKQTIDCQFIFVDYKEMLKLFLLVKSLVLYKNNTVWIR